MEKAATDFLSQWPLVASLVFGAVLFWIFQQKLESSLTAKSKIATDSMEKGYGQRIAKLEMRVGTCETILGEGHDMAVDLLDNLPLVPENVPSRRTATALVKKLGDVKA